jgi:hypothetical protein
MQEKTLAFFFIFFGIPAQSKENWKVIRINYIRFMKHDSQLTNLSEQTTNFFCIITWTKIFSKQEKISYNPFKIVQSIYKYLKCILNLV